MKITWSQTASTHLTEIHDYIARDSPMYARRMVDRITRRSSQVERFPELAGVVPEYADRSIREVLEGPYRIIYRIRPDSIVVLAVIHAARVLGDQPPE